MLDATADAVLGIREAQSKKPTRMWALLSGLEGLVQVIFQGLAWAKFRHLGGFDLDRCTSAWVSPSASCALGHSKAAKSNQGHGATFLSVFVTA